MEVVGPRLLFTVGSPGQAISINKFRGPGPSMGDAVASFDVVMILASVPL